MPNSVRNVMGAGMAALTAQQIGGTVADNLTALGNSQGTAYAIYSDNVIFTTVAASAGAILPAAAAGVQPGDEVAVANLGANALSVYPPVGGTINGGATNAAFAVGAGKTAYFIARPGGLNWIAILSA